MAYNVSTEELQSFHSIDRDLFTRFVVQLRRDPFQTMRIMALWLWLEEAGYPSIILALSALPADYWVNLVADEAVTILYSFASENTPPASCDTIPMTFNLINQEVSLQLLHEFRVPVLDGINKVLTKVCTRAFGDILQGGNGNHQDVGTKPVPELRVVTQDDALPEQLIRPAIPFLRHGLHPAFHPLFHFRGLGPVAYLQQRDAPVMPNVPFLFPGEGPQDSSNERHFEVGDSSNQAPYPTEQSYFPIVDEPPEDRTMFMTFSRGYPISEAELRAYFFRGYGDVIEDINMEYTTHSIQPLYARVVFHSPDTVEEVLNGREKIKFIIKGKHVWTRRYVARN
ncbi:hypothetical protein IFM89_026847 [Coptis chinensis]|uniref:RRM domain-containing protein n=1 Tax=Coptis chinensis TaxID=261450 RepID=A0A835HV21_9MAGN|nr:hypothetical protein IFM89_026847 [Coptis chinensis]